MTLRASDTENAIQAFAPDPTKTTTLTIAAGGSSQTWTPAVGTKTYCFYPSIAVQMKLNSNSTGLQFDAATICGPFAINGKTSTIVFADLGTAGGTVIIEAD